MGLLCVEEFCPVQNIAQITLSVIFTASPIKLKNKNKIKPSRFDGQWLLVLLSLLVMWSMKSHYPARTKRASPKGLRAESARAVTGRRCPHSGEGEDFMTRQPDFFYKNCRNSRKESRKIVPKVGNERSLYTCKKRVMLRRRLFWPKKICGKSA